MAAIRVNVIGASGCGTSTVGRSLATALSIPHFDADDYFHAPTDPPFQKPRDPDDRYAMTCRDLCSESNWVLSGSVMGWTPSPTPDFTCIVFLYVPTDVRLERLRSREHERFGSRIKIGGDMQSTHEDFIDWASRYDAGDIDGKTLARHQEYLKKQNIPVMEFRGEMPVSEITKKVLASLGQREINAEDDV